MEMIYSSLFLNYMRYKHEIFTKMILKDGFIISAMEAVGLESEEFMINLEASFYTYCNV
jgi:hypothetical protein